MADSLLDLAGVPGGTPPPENPGVLAAIDRMRQRWQSDVNAYNAQGGNGLLQYGPFSPSGEYANAAMQPGMSGYFQADQSGNILPRAFSPQEVAQQAGLSDPRQVFQGFTPSGGYDEVRYNIPNDRGGFFNANANSLPTLGQGLSTNNWRLLGKGPGYIMRQGNLINMLDPNTRFGLPAGIDSSFSDTAESGAGLHRFVAPGGSFSGRNKWDAFYWPGGSVTGRTRWPYQTDV